MNNSGQSEQRKGTRSGQQDLAAFTLIELLVVLAIIALLAALIFPAINRAKESGKGAACISNLRQAGIALQLYVQENNNRLPQMRDKSLTTKTNELPGPDEALISQLGNRNVLRCPSDKWPAELPELVEPPDPRFSSRSGPVIRGTACSTIKRSKIWRFLIFVSKLTKCHSCLTATNSIWPEVKPRL